MNIKQVLQENNKTIDNIIDLLVEFSGNSREEILGYPNLKRISVQREFNKYYQSENIYIPFSVISKLHEIKSYANILYYENTLDIVKKLYLNKNLDNINISRFYVMNLWHKERDLFDKKILGPDKMHDILLLIDESKGSL